MEGQIMDPVTILTLLLVALATALEKLVKAVAARQRAEAKAEIIRARAELVRAEAERSARLKGPKFGHKIPAGDGRG
jgi:hypothetical protein